MKKTTYKRIYIYGLCTFMTLWIFGTANAQEERRLTLDQAIAETLQNNWSMRKYDQRLGMAKADKNSANAAILPSISLSEKYMATTDPMLAFGTKLGQSSITNLDFDPNRLNDPSRVSNFNTMVEVAQPIFNLDGIQARRSAMVMHEAVINDREWAREMLTLETKNLYFNLMLAIKGRGVVARAKLAADASTKTSQDLFDQGMITKADLMGAKLRATQVKSSLLQADHLVVNLNNDLLQLLGADKYAVIIPTDSLPDHTVVMEILNEVSIPMGRSDLQALQLQSEASDLNYKSKKAVFIPRVNAFGSYRFNDTDLFGTKADNYLLGVQMKWNVFQGSKNIGAAQRAKYESEHARLAYEEKLSSAQRNLDRLKNDFILADQQVELAMQSMHQSAELFKIRNDRYAEGLEKTSDLLADESIYLNRQLGLLQSQNNYLQLLFRLETELSKNLTTL